jgi:hypothetical protein
LTTSANSSFDLQAQQVIKTALQLCQVLNAGLEPDPDQNAMGMTLLDLGLKALQNDGIFLRTVERTTVPFIAISPQGVITTEPDTLDVESLYYSDSQHNDVPILLIPRRRYMELSNKDTVGPPSQAYIEKTDGVVTINLHPVGNVAVISVTYAKVRRFRDVDTAGVTLDIPSKWLRCVTYMLAADFALHYGRIDRADSLRQTYENERDRAMNDETERGESRFVLSERYSPYG